MRIICICLLCLLSYFSLSAQNFGGNPSSVKWKQVNTDKARVIFPTGLDSQAKRMAGIMKLLGDTTSQTIGGQQRKWNIILQNQLTIPNAYVRLAPLMSELYMTPSQDNFSTGSLRWDDNLIIHENRHMQQFSNFNKGFTKVFSFLLGEEGQLLANGMTVPDYFFEGDAVWQETLVSAQGRGRMPSFYNGFKSLWLANKNYSWMKLRNGSYKDFTPDHYALGYQLIAYGNEKYGADFWSKITNDAVRFKGVFYPFNRAIERYSGKTYRQFSNDAMQYFKAKTLPAKSLAVTAFNYLTKEEKNNVIDYRFAGYISDDSIVVTKNSYKEVPAFYIISNGKETKLRVRDIGIDDYYSYRNGKIVYAAYQSDPRWANRDYSVIKLLDIYNGEQKQITYQSKYFSPDINAAGTEILAVQVNTNGSNNLVRIVASTGNLIQKIPNPDNYFFTQSKYINADAAVSAVRNPDGKMALVKIDLTNGTTESLTPFTYNVLGYPAVKGDTIYLTAMNGNADKIFAVTLQSKKIFSVTNNNNGVYSPAVNNKGELMVSAFTAGGYMLAKVDLAKADWQEFNTFSSAKVDNDLFAGSEMHMKGAGALYALDENNNTWAVTKFRKSFRLFNFHSWRPVVDDPEYGYNFFSDNILSSFRNNISYTYNRSDRSHTIGFNTAFAGWFPIINAGAEESFNRTVDTAFGKSVSYNAATLKAGVSIPFRFVGGRTNKFLSVGAGYNLEQYYYNGLSKNVFKNKAINYMNAFLSFSNIGQQARQHVNPRWAQSLSVNYRDALNFRNSHKFVAHASFYFPGIGRNHSLVINTAYQNRDTLPDLFSKVFSYSRGYEALSTRRMYKLGVNYQLPVVYPDWGFANLLYFQRIRANAFYDYTNAKARVNNVLTEVINSSTGAEIYFDTKIWNAFPVSIGVRFSHLLNTDLLNPAVKNRWEIILPIGLIPD
ncbi:MAG: hypothetical protein IPP81_15775 [Chitinophagaceae bacterium]|nr:hypothetical protein [Chitinophagaceae bacterium]